MRPLSALLLALLALAAPSLAPAQTQGRIYRLGVLLPNHTRFVERVVLPELAARGFVEGRNLSLDVRIGPAAELPDLARALTATAPDAIFAVAPAAVGAAAAASGTVPIVMLASADPVRAGWVASLARPGRNVTGVLILGPELDPKRLQILKEIVPGARRLAMLRDPEVTSAERRKAIESAARGLGVELDDIEARQPGDIATGFRQARQLGADAVNVLASPLFSTEADSVAGAAIETRLPTICHWREMAEAGCLASYGPPFSETFRVAAVQLARIFGGARPAEMPVEQPTKFELVLNQRTARAIGIELPGALVANADELIE
jgi:putative ABC transport system substrate-binding protein